MQGVRHTGSEGTIPQREGRMGNAKGEGCKGIVKESPVGQACSWRETRGMWAQALMGGRKSLNLTWKVDVEGSGWGEIDGGTSRNRC